MRTAARIVAGVVMIASAGCTASGAALSMGGGPGSAADTSLTTILLVRHAERDTMWLGADMPLSRAGERRAEELARVLCESGASAIYVTEWRRNRETAEPLARELGDTLRVLAGRDFAAQARQLRAHRGETVVVIGHSDTVPQLHEALTGKPWRGYRGGEWDAILAVTLGPGGVSKTVLWKYGAPASGRPAPPLN
jgi:phosphohistidine phosphatase SixA